MIKYSIREIVKQSFNEGYIFFGESAWAAPKFHDTDRRFMTTNINEAYRFLQYLNNSNLEIFERE